MACGPLRSVEDPTWRTTFAWRVCAPSASCPWAGSGGVAEWVRSSRVAMARKWPKTRLEGGSEVGCRWRRTAARKASASRNGTEDKGGMFVVPRLRRPSGSGAGLNKLSVRRPGLCRIFIKSRTYRPSEFSWNSKCPPPTGAPERRYPYGCYR